MCNAWTMCKERMIAADTEVLLWHVFPGHDGKWTCIEKGHYADGPFGETGWYEVDGNERHIPVDEITHWRPLPVGPDGSEESVRPVAIETKPDRLNTELPLVDFTVVQELFDASVYIECIKGIVGRALFRLWQNRLPQCGERHASLRMSLEFWVSDMGRIGRAVCKGIEVMHPGDEVVWGKVTQFEVLPRDLAWGKNAR